MISWTYLGTGCGAFVLEFFKMPWSEWNLNTSKHLWNTIYDRVLAFLCLLSRQISFLFNFWQVIYSRSKYFGNCETKPWTFPLFECRQKSSTLCWDAEVPPISSHTQWSSSTSHQCSLKGQFMDNTSGRMSRTIPTTEIRTNPKD